MRRETMHVSHVGTSRMRQWLRQAGFDMTRTIMPTKLALALNIDLRTVTTVDFDVKNPDRRIFLQAA